MITQQQWEGHLKKSPFHSEVIKEINWFNAQGRRARMLILEKMREAVKKKK